jgi:hypothetical protein
MRAVTCLLALLAACGEESAKHYDIVPPFPSTMHRFVNDGFTFAKRRRAVGLGLCNLPPAHGRPVATTR